MTRTLIALIFFGISLTPSLVFALDGTGVNLFGSSKTRPEVPANEDSGFVILLASRKIEPAHLGSDSMLGAQDSDSIGTQTDTLDNDDSELFGWQGGYVHPYLDLSAEYTDNLFNIAEEKTSSWIGRITPGIWLSLPRNNQTPISITPSNTSPGGLQYQRRDVPGTDRFEAYALGEVTYETYSEESELDDYNARLEGLLRYNMGVGLSLQVLDRYSYDQDRLEINTAVKQLELEFAEDRFEEETGIAVETDENVRRFESNLLMATADYSITEKFRLKGDFSNFVVDYESAINDFLDRTDNSAEFYGYFNYSPKTAFFIQYRYIDVAYDNEPADGRPIRDNEQQFWYGGVNWASTEKLAFAFKAGQQFRRYNDDEVAEGNDRDNLALDVQSVYRWTEKTQFTLDLYHLSEESESAVALDKVTLGMAFGYRQRFTDRLQGVLTFRYEDSDYNQLFDQIVSVEELEREDRRISVRPALIYNFREWMRFELAYTYDKRDSTDDLFDYTTNRVLLGLYLSM